MDTTETNPPRANQKSNRITITLLFLLFVVPVVIAYIAYFNQWFHAASQAKGELLNANQVVDIEDYRFIKEDGNPITGKEFETLYWWILPYDTNQNTDCNLQCLNLNLYTLNQTYIGLGKEQGKINPLLVLPHGSPPLNDLFSNAFSEFSPKGVKSLPNNPSGLNLDLSTGFIYLVDPLGNIFMRYPLIQNEEDTLILSKNLRTDIKRLFKYSRLG